MGHASLLLVAVIAAIVGVVGVGGCGSSPPAQLTDASIADPECAAELVAGLVTYRDELGFDIEVGPADADAIGESGHVEKSYARDGAQYTVDFGLEGADAGACDLEIRSITEVRPGSTVTRSGGYSPLPLDVCRCE